MSSRYFNIKSKIINIKITWFDLCCENSPDLRKLVPVVSWTKAAALVQYSCLVPNEGHSDPSFFRSSNIATYWTKAACSLSLPWVRSLWGRSWQLFRTSRWQHQPSFLKETTRCLRTEKRQHYKISHKQNYVIIIIILKANEIEDSHVSESHKQT